MNQLPDWRKAISGRTWHSTWSASSYDPIICYRRSHVADWLMAIGIGIVGGWILVLWIMEAL